MAQDIKEKRTVYGWKRNALISVSSCIPLISCIIYTDLNLPTFLLDLSCLHLAFMQNSGWKVSSPSILKHYIWNETP